VTYQLVSNGDVPDESYFNALMQQGVIVCTSGTRPGSPLNGMCIFETDTSLFRSYSTARVEWVPYGTNGNLTWTPTLSATTTPPTMGTGAVRTGKYTWLPGGYVCASFYIQFGTSGVAAGTGQYQVTLPVTAQVDRGGTAQEADGVGKINDASPSTNYPVIWYLPGSAPTLVVGVSTSANASVTQASPMAWAINDHLSGTVTYRAVVP
jgi:hypothetical protein